MFQIFVVFHKKIFDECYENISQEDLDKYFTFFAVNESIQKEYTKNKYKIINEWELPNYDPEFQLRGYNENSAIYHIYINKLYENYDYIGFVQYDMYFNNGVISNINNINSTYTDIHYLIPKEPHPQLLSYSFAVERTWVNDWPQQNILLSYILNDYENHFNNKLNTNNVCPLWNTYIISKSTYEKIMPWVIGLYDKIYLMAIELQGTTWEGLGRLGYIGGIYERIMALAICGEGLDFYTFDLNHAQDKYKKECY